jgi:hypothetical protein
VRPLPFASSESRSCCRSLPFSLILRCYRLQQGHIQIRGLQFAQAVADDQPLTGHFGYLYSWYAFKAPEIDSDFYHDKSVDLWSLGAALCKCWFCQLVLFALSSLLTEARLARYATYGITAFPR